LAFLKLADFKGRLQKEVGYENEPDEKGKNKEG
jgi:hypothetical protein